MISLAQKAAYFSKIWIIFVVLIVIGVVMALGGSWMLSRGLLLIENELEYRTELHAFNQEILEIRENPHTDIGPTLTSLQKIEAPLAACNHNVSGIVRDFITNPMAKDGATISSLCFEGAELVAKTIADIEQAQHASTSREEILQILDRYLEQAQDNSSFLKNHLEQRFSHHYRRSVAFTVMLAAFTLGLLAFMTRMIHVDFRRIEELRKETLAASQRLSLYTKVTMDGIWDIPDIDKDSGYWSPNVKQVLGYAKDEDMPSSPTNLIKMIHPEHRQEALENWKRLKKAGESFRRELKLKTRSGKYRWYRIIAISTEDSITGKTHITGSIRDINNRKVTEIELKDSMDFLELMINALPDMLIVKDEQHRILQANQTYYDAFPKDLHKLIPEGKAAQAWDPEKAKMIDAEDDIAFRDGYIESIHPLRNPDGKEGTFHFRKVRFENTEGEKFVLCISSDITEKQQLIDQVVQSNQELEQFAFVASHDLQEPLRTIQNYSKNLYEEIKGSMTPEASNYLNIIEDSSHRLQKLIRDLLSYARVDDRNEQIAHIDMNALVQEVIAQFEPKLAEVEGQILYEELPDIRLQKSKIQLLLSNLISNALKYQIAGNKPVIKISAIEKEHSYEFCIQDNGIGIEERFHERVFQPFKRLHRKEEYPGSGVGLAICRKIVNQLGGKIWIESNTKMGSNFFFDIPK